MKKEKLPNQRNTLQRRVIGEVITRSTHPLTVEEIHAGAIRHQPKIGIATIYREVKRLQETGEIATVELPGEKPRYEKARMAHHHHFKCTACETVYDIPGCNAHAPTLPKGFTHQSHEMLIYGHCGQCNL